MRKSPNFKARRRCKRDNVDATRTLSIRLRPGENANDRTLGELRARADNRPILGKNRIARFLIALEDGLPKGGIVLQAVYMVIAAAPCDGRGWLSPAWDIDRIAKVAGVTPRKATTAVLKLESTERLSIRRKGRRIDRLRLRITGGIDRVIEMRTSLSRGLIRTILTVNSGHFDFAEMTMLMTLVAEGGDGVRMTYDQMAKRIDRTQRHVQRLVDGTNSREGLLARGILLIETERDTWPDKSGELRSGKVVGTEWCVTPDVFHGRATQSCRHGHREVCRMAKARRSRRACQDITGNVRPDRASDVRPEMSRPTRTLLCRWHRIRGWAGRCRRRFPAGRGVWFGQITRRPTEPGTAVTIRPSTAQPGGDGGSGAGKGKSRTTSPRTRATAATANTGAPDQSRHRTAEPTEAPAEAIPPAWLDDAPLPDLDDYGWHNAEAA